MPYFSAVTDRRFPIGQPGLAGATSAPGLVMDDEGNVILVGPDGRRTSLTALSAAFAGVASQEELPPGAQIVSYRYGGADADSSATEVIGTFPNDCYVFGAAYVPDAAITFPLSDVDGTIHGRNWLLVRRRPSLADPDRVPHMVSPPGGAPLPGWTQFEATIAQFVVDGDDPGPWDDSLDPDAIEFLGYGMKPTEGHGAGSMEAGIPHPFIVDADVAMQLRAGDVLLIQSGVAVDDKNPNHDPIGGDIIEAPADAGGLVYIGIVPVTEITGDPAVMLRYDSSPSFDDGLDEPAESVPDPTTSYLGVPPDAVVLDADHVPRVPLSALHPDQLDPGGGGGPPSKYCFEWFGQKWGGDYADWCAFVVTQLRPRGQSEAKWACDHRDLALCIGAQVCDTAGNPTGLPYACDPPPCNDISCAKINAGIATPFPVATQLAGKATVGVAATYLTIQATKGDNPLKIDVVRLEQQLLEALTPAHRRTTEVITPFQNASGTATIEIDPLVHPGTADGVLEWEDVAGAASSLFGQVVKLSVIAGGVTLVRYLARSTSIANRARRSRKQCLGVIEADGLRPNIDILPIGSKLEDVIGSLGGFTPSASIFPFNINTGVVTGMMPTAPAAVIAGAQIELQIWKGGVGDPLQPGWTMPAGAEAKSVGLLRLTWPFKAGVGYGRSAFAACLIKQRVQYGHGKKRSPNWRSKWTVRMCIRRDGPEDPTIVPCVLTGWSSGMTEKAKNNEGGEPVYEFDPFTRDLNNTDYLAFPGGAYRTQVISGPLCT